MIGTFPSCCAFVLFSALVASVSAAPGERKVMKAAEFPSGSNGFYLEGEWLAIDPRDHREATTSQGFPFEGGCFDVIFMAVGENDGRSRYRIAVNDAEIGTFTVPAAKSTSESGPKYNTVFESVEISRGDRISVQAMVDSRDGSGSTRGRWAGLAFVGPGKGKEAPGSALAVTKSDLKSKYRKGFEKIRKAGTTYTPTTDPSIREADGDGEVTISGESKQWHKVTLTLDGPFAHELDEVNPFLDYRMMVKFSDATGRSVYTVPGYFAADGDAAETSADAGTAWRAHLCPDVTGEWTYEISFHRGNGIAISEEEGEAVPPFQGKTGRFSIGETDKAGRDLRARGRLTYDGTRYLKTAGDEKIFFKVGADAPENLLAYVDFDGPQGSDGQKDHHMKTWEPHLADWKRGDPTWGGGDRGKGLVGAINYLASKGMNAFSFLTMNIAGDDANVFPYLHYDERFRNDCSRLDQWEIIFEHGTSLGMFLHFKMMETENELLLDFGDLGPERKFYYRELIARFAHHPALNWNLGEEINNATTEQKASWARYLHENDPYRNHIVIHNMGEPHYDLMGLDFALTGFSLQTNKPDFSAVHDRTFEYIERSAAAGKPWAVACDEPGDAQHALVTDAEDPEHDNARMNGLWGVFLAGGWGTEWYFGYAHPESDLTCQDWRSRDLFWDQGRIALEFLQQNDLPYGEMWCRDELIGGAEDYVFAKPGEAYLVYLKRGENTLDLRGDAKTYALQWFNPRTGESVEGDEVEGLDRVSLAAPDRNDWLAVLTN